MDSPVLFAFEATATSEIPKCTTAVPDRYGHVPPDACNANYGFFPSWEGNLALAVAFGLTTLIHVAQAVVFKKTFCWVVIMGALWETICFALRTIGAHDQQNLDYVIVSTLLFLLAPLWINAFAYMTVARLAHFLLPSPRIRRIPSKWLAKIFVAADVVTFGIQAAGGAMLADQDDLDTITRGQHIYMAGIGAQLIFVLCFVYFAFPLISLPLDSASNKASLRLCRLLVWSVFAVLGLIIVRIVFRLIEFGGGVSSSNTVLMHEAYQMCLDALPMWLALVLLNIVHPGLLLKGPESSFPPVWSFKCMSQKDGV